MLAADLLFPTYLQQLGTLSGLIAKARNHPRGDALLSARLADDMFPLSTQIRFICNMPGEHLRTLAGAAFTSADEDDTMLDGAATRVEKARAWVSGFDRSTLHAPDAPASFTLPNGMTFDLSVEEYIRDWALPQFYFHIVAAYSILRAEGLEIGKADYVPYMVRYMPGTAAA